VTIGGVQYREFLLDINQQGANPLLSLDNVRIFLTNTANASAATNPANTNAFGAPIYTLDTATNSKWVQAICPPRPTRDHRSGVFSFFGP
jgi:hypothetical protein